MFPGQCLSAASRRSTKAIVAKFTASFHRVVHRACSAPFGPVMSCSAYDRLPDTLPKSGVAVGVPPVCRRIGAGRLHRLHPRVPMSTASATLALTPLRGHRVMRFLCALAADDFTDVEYVSS